MLLDYQSMSTSSLIDMLATETTRFTQLMAEKKFGKEYEACKEVIHQIQAVLQVRQTITASNESAIKFAAPDSTL